MTAVDDKQVSKVQRLLALAQDQAAAPAEAAAALAKARELMASMDEAALARLRQRPAQEVQSRAAGIHQHQDADWVNMTAWAVARKFRVEVYYVQDQLMFLGFPEDIDVAQAAVHFAVQAGATAGLLWQLDHPRASGRDIHSWFMGFKDGLAEALRQQDAADSTVAIVLAMPNQVTERLRQLTAGGHPIRYTEHRANAAAVADGRQAGLEVGERVKHAGQPAMQGTARGSLGTGAPKPLKGGD